jgi:hypothetical protein
MMEEPTCHPCKVTLLPIPSVKPQGSLAQEANCKAQASSLPDLLCLRPAVPFMQTPLDENPGAFCFCPVDERWSNDLPPGLQNQAEGLVTPLV